MFLLGINCPTHHAIGQSEQVIRLPLYTRGARVLGKTSTAGAAGLVVLAVDFWAPKFNFWVAFSDLSSLAGCKTVRLFVRVTV